MIDLPYETLIGVAYGLLTGFVPALVVGCVAIALELNGARSLHVGLGATVAGGGAVVTGISVGIFDPAVGGSQAARIVIGATVAGLLGVVAASQGARIATELPRDRTFPIVRGTALSAAAIDAVDAIGQVTIRPTGAIREFEGYPPLSPGLRSALDGGAWRFPADLQLAELERRLERRLETTYDLASVEVSVDGRGRATIAAGPPANGVARTLEADTRAVTVSGLLPTGIEPGDRVAIETSERTVRGEVLAFGDDADRSDDRPADGVAGPTDLRRADVGFDGGVGRLTVAVPTADAGVLLEAPCRRIAVLPTGDARAYEATALLEDAGRAVTEVKLADDAPVDSAETLAVRTDERWRFDVDGTALDRADRAFVVGSSPAVSDR